MSDKKPGEVKKKVIDSHLYLASQDVDAAILLAENDNHYAAYHCQQAAEKFLCALLIHHDIEPVTDRQYHQLDLMIAKLPDTESWKSEVKWMDHYTTYATTFRYPSTMGKTKDAPNPKTVITDAQKIADLIARARKRFVTSPS